jgi:hypothetical protein
MAGGARLGKVFGGMAEEGRQAREGKRTSALGFWAKRVGFCLGRDFGNFPIAYRVLSRAKQGFHLFAPGIKTEFVCSGHKI